MTASPFSERPQSGGPADAPRTDEDAPRPPSAGTGRHSEPVQRALSFAIALAFVLGSTAPSTGLAAQSDGSSEPTSSASTPSRSGDRPGADERLERAEKAFNRGDFDRIPPLLRPTLRPEPAFESESKIVRARELLGVGLFFSAQQATDAQTRSHRLEAARRHFLELLRLRPDYELDPLVFPASVVEVFESVRQAHAEELETIREARRSKSNASKHASKPLYIERNVRERSYAVNFLPFGLGQFQNDEPIQGGLFAGGQIAAIGIVVAGSAVIESLRNQNGRFSVDPNGRGHFSRAFAWRRVQYAALGAFVALYGWSVA
ncbi:MAG: hypothetical protein ABEL76_15975, partial [Bradymonadaceae bacterium]